MAADHHQFVFQLGIGAGNFSDGVKAVLVIAGNLVSMFISTVNRHPRFHQSIHATVVLNRHGRDG